MASTFRVWSHEIPQGQDWEPLDRVSGRDGVRLVEGGVTDIDIRIYEVPERDVGYELLAQSPSAGTNPNVRVFDTLQTDGRWKPDDVGYNVRVLIPWADMVAATPFFPVGGKTYRLELTINTTSWGDIISVHEYRMLPIWNVRPA